MSQIDDFLSGKPSGSKSEIDGFLGEDKPKGGFGAAAKQAVGAVVKGAGQAVEDFAPDAVGKDNAIKRYGQGVIDANPTAVTSGQDILDSPWTAVKEAVGNAAGSMGPMLGARALGMGVTAAAPLTGPFAPATALAGQAIANVGPFVAAALPSFGGIREKQIEKDPNSQSSTQDKAVAALGAGTVGLIEGKFGPEAAALKMMTQQGRAALGKKFAETTLAKGIGYGALKGAAVEGAEELAQNPIEQLAAYDDPRTPENIKDTLFGGAMGAIGGGVLGGGVGAVNQVVGKKRDATVTPQPADTQPADPLLIGNTPDPYLSFADGTVARKSEIDAYIGGLPKDQQPAARAKIMGLAPQPADTTDQASQEATASLDASRDQAIESGGLVPDLPAKPSEAMGLAPTAGPSLANAAILSVDTGLHQAATAEADPYSAPLSALGMELNKTNQRLREEADALGLDTEGLHGDAARMTDGKPHEDYLMAANDQIRKAMKAAKEIPDEGSKADPAMAEDGAGTKGPVTQASPAPAAGGSGPAGAGAVRPTNDRVGGTGQPAAGTAAGVAPAAVGDGDDTVSRISQAKNMVGESELMRRAKALANDPRLINKGAEVGGVPADAVAMEAAARATVSGYWIEPPSTAPAAKAPDVKATPTAPAAPAAGLPAAGSAPVQAAGVSANRRLSDGIKDLGRIIVPGFYSEGYPWQTGYKQESGSSIAQDGKDIISSVEAYGAEGAKLRDAIRHAELNGDPVPDEAYQRLESIKTAKGTTANVPKPAQPGTQASQTPSTQGAAPAVGDTSAPVGTAVATEPWKMTRKEYAQQGGDISYSSEGSGSHRGFVEAAVSRGETISPEVLKDYPWIAADQNIKPYADGLRNLSDNELRSEEKRATDALNKWANKTPAINKDGGEISINPQLHTVDSFEVSARFNAVNNEIERRKDNPNEAPTSGPVAPEAKAPKQNALQKRVQKAQQDRADYFTPGNIVKSYSGHDRVIGYTPPVKDGGNWSVRVQSVVKQGDKWVNDPKDNRERQHSTPPDAKELASGPVFRNPVQPQGATSEPQADQAQQAETQRPQEPAAAAEPVAARTATEHAGMKIYPTKVKVGDAVVDMWGVQTKDNARREKNGERQIGGDPLSETLDGAKKNAEAEVRDAKSRAEREAESKAADDAAQAKKDANKGKSILQRRADALLDKQHTYPPQAGLGQGTRREAMQKSVDQGRAIVERMVPDTAAKHRDQTAIDLVKARGYILGLSNENIPVVKQGLEAQARMKADQYEKPEYRVYDSAKTDGGFYEITKTEFDYAKSLTEKAKDPHENYIKSAADSIARLRKSDVYRVLDSLAKDNIDGVTREGLADYIKKNHPDYAQEVDDVLTELSQPTPATPVHQDPGAAPEAATAPVIAESLQKAAKKEERPLAEMKAELLGMIDAAVKETPNYKDYLDAVTKFGKDEAEQMYARKDRPMGGDTVEGKGSITFDVPGDGKFRVTNSYAGLMAFRAKINKASGNGFSETKRPGLPASTSVKKGSTNQISAIESMLEDGDLQAAKDYMTAVGIGTDGMSKSALDRMEQLEALGDKAQEALYTRIDPAWEYSVDRGSRRATLTRTIGKDVYRAWVNSGVKENGEPNDFGTATYSVTVKGGKAHDNSAPSFHDALVFAQNLITLEERNYSKNDGAESQDTPASKAKATPAEAAPISSVQGQKNLASRGIRIATLKMMNEQIRKLDPTEAWHDSNIEDATDLDALQDSISQTLVDLQRKAKPEVSKTGKLPVFPVDAYRLERFYANGAKIKPLPARTFSLQEVQSITDWFKSIGWSVTSGSGGNGINATNDIGMTVDDLPEPYTAAQRKKDEALLASDERAAAKKKEQEGYLASTAAGKFVAGMFGDAMNRSNQVALAKVLSGDEKTFAGLFSNSAVDVLSEAGISAEGREIKDVIRDIKAMFDAAPTSSAKEPWQMTEAEFGEVERQKALANVKYDLERAKNGSLKPFVSGDKSKPALVRRLTAEVAQIESTKPEGYAGDHLAQINKALREGKPVPEVNLKRYDIAAPKAEQSIANQTFDQWVRQTYEDNEYKASYLRKANGNEKEAMLRAATGWTDADAKPADMLKEARRKYFSELTDQPREASISLEVFDALPPAMQTEAQRHFYDLDGRLTRRTQDDTTARVKAENSAKKPYEDALAEVSAEIARLDKISGPETQKQKDLSGRRARLEEAIWQIGQGKEPDGRLLKKAAPAQQEAPTQEQSTPAQATPENTGNAGSVVSPDEFPLDEATRSYDGISQHSATRARSDRDQFVKAIQDEYDAAEKVAETPEQRAVLESEAQSLKADYLSRYKQMMGVRSGAYSGFFVGRANLNVKQADKRNDALTRANETFDNWLTENTGRIKSAVLKARNADQLAAVQEAKDAKAADKERRDLALMGKILAFKSGDDLRFGTAIVTRVSLDKDGYPNTITIKSADGTPLINDKINLASEIFGGRGIRGVQGGKQEIRRLADIVRLGNPNPTTGHTIGPGNADVAFSRGTPFYSELSRQIEASNINAAPGFGWKATLKGLMAKGVKADEITWSGIEEWLDLQTGKVTKAQVLDYLAANGVQVEEVTLGESKSGVDEWEVVRNGPEDYDVVDGAGDVVEAGFLARSTAQEFIDSEAKKDGTKYSQYTLPGGERYREVLLTLPKLTYQYVGLDSLVESADDNRKQAFEDAMKQKYGGETFPSVYRKLSGSEVDRYEQIIREVRQSESNARSRSASRMARAHPLVNHPSYESAHWDQPNVLAHIRVNDRTDADGKRVLFVEEIQSDFGQEGKKRGFSNAKLNMEKPVVVFNAKTGENMARFKSGAEAEAYIQQQDPSMAVLDYEDTTGRGGVEEGKVPLAPFVDKTDKWLTLSLKRIVKMAVDGGYDRVAFVNGEQSAARYDLSKEVKNIEWTQYGSGTKVLSINPKSGNAIEVLVEEDGTTASVSGRDAEFAGKPLSDVVGKEIAEKIMAQRSGDLRGDGLKVGGEGMKAFYDQIVPSATKALLKKLGGGQMEDVRFREDRGFEDSYQRSKGMVIPPITQPGFTITPAMQEKASGGLPLFAKNTTQFSPAAQAQSVEAVERVVSGIADAWQNGPRVVVAFDMQDARIPERIRLEDQKQRSGGARGAPEGFYYDGTAYLMASQLKTPNDTARVLFHEALGHFGLRRAFGGALKPILQQIVTMRRAQVDAKVKEYGLRGVSNLDLLTAAEEVLAEMAQTTPEIGFVKRAIAAIRTWLRANVPGFKNLALTDDEIIRSYILPARGWVERGPGGGGPKGGVSFARGAKSSNAENTRYSRQWYDRLVSLLPDSYRNDPHRREPLPAEGRDVQRTREVQGKVDALNREIRGPKDTKGYGPVSVDPLGNLQVDARNATYSEIIGEIKDLADEIGYGVTVTGVQVRLIEKFKQAGFESEISLAAIADRLTGARDAISDEKSVYAVQALGTIMSYKPRGFPMALFSRSDQTQTEAFKRWFAGSRVVDSEGKPLRVYHGTARDFAEFKSEAQGDNFGDYEGAFPRDGFWFTGDPSNAQWYANVSANGLEGERAGGGQKTIPAYLSIKNPYRYTVDMFADEGEAGIPSQVELEAQGYDGIVVEIAEDDDGSTVPAEAEAMWKEYAPIHGAPVNWPADLRAKYNDLLDVPPSLKYTHYVAFRPEQIKSSIGNNGDFDPDTADIRFSRATTARELTKKATEAVRVFTNTPGKVNWWHKTIGTQYNLAQRSPQFKRVYDAVQDFIGDVSFYATEAADLAPKILPKLDTWRDIAKSPVSGEDTKAIAAPIFEGTLVWARNEAGQPVKIKQLEEEAALMSSDKKSQRLLRNDKISEGVLKMWRGLPMEQYEALIDGKYEKEMLKAGVVWSDAELKSQFNLNDGQIALYKEFRAATDKSLTNLAISDMLYFGGKDVAPIKEAVLDAKTVDEAAEMLRDYLMSLADMDPDKRESRIASANKMIEKGDRVNDLMARGYAPLSRFGTYTLDVVDADGERVYFGLFESRFEADRMAKQMAAEYPGSTVDQGTLSEESYKLFSGVSPETVALFGDMLGLEDNGAYQDYLKLAKSTRSAMKRLIQRKGIAGFSEDAGRVLAGFVYSNARQTSQNMHTGEMVQAANDIPKGMGELKDKATQLVEYIKHPQEEAQKIRGLLFAQYIGGSIASAMVNMTQPLTMTLPWLTQFGGLSKASKQMAAAVKDATRKTTGDKALDAALKRGEEDGTVSPQEVHDLMRQAQGKGALKSGDGTKLGNAAAAAQNVVSRIGFGWGKLFSTAEQFNRRATFIAAYRTAVEQGMKNPDAFARRAIHETQGVYNCVDAETECLTLDGWKRHDQMEIGEQVYAIDKAGGLVESSVIDMHRYTGAIPATEFRNSNGFSMVVTDQHNMLIRSHNSRDAKYGTIRKVHPGDVKAGHHFLRVPLHDSTSRPAIYTDDEVRLFAWVAAEGNLFSHRNVKAKRGVSLVQSQQHNPEYVAEIDALLARLGGHFNRKTARCGEMVCWQLRKPLWLKIHYALPEKMVRMRLVNDLTPAQMALFLDTFTKGDGHFPEDGGNSITQKDVGNLDALQTMAILSGQTSTKYDRMGRHDFGTLYIAKNSKHAHSRPMTRTRVELPMAWCPQTEHGTWIARRNGRTFVTGNSGNKPDWARGAVGSTLFTFKQYSIAYVEMLHRMATTGEPGSPERAAGRRGALYALAVLMLLSGLGGMPGADDLDDIISGLMQALGYNFDSKAKRKAFLAEYLGDGAAQFMERGVSGLAGVPIDISGRMGLGNLIPATGLLTKKADHTQDVAELLGPAGDLFKRGFQAGGKLVQGDVFGNHGAIATASPKAVQNLFQAADMADKGMYRDQTGKKVMETGPGDALAKALGFQPNDVKRAQDVNWQVQQMKDLNRIKESEIASRWAIGLFEKDPEKIQSARDDLATWNADNPDAQIRINFAQIRKRVQDMNMTKAERIAKTTPAEIRARVRNELALQ